MQLDWRVPDYFGLAMYYRRRGFSFQAAYRLIFGRAPRKV